MVGLKNIITNNIKHERLQKNVFTNQYLCFSTLVLKTILIIISYNYPIVKVRKIYK